MRIQHNIMAMNAYRNLSGNQSALSKNLEKLSSGYRINRAGDDAAGLAISEKMRAQITGLDAAQKNVKDGISLVKTAEGAMQEVQDMLSRMKYLATQSSNGTYDQEVDRANLQKEVESLRNEINRIADSANFNGQKLMDGSLSATGLGDQKFKLPDVGSAQGLNSTVLASEKISAAKTKFTVDLGNTKIEVANGKKGTITLNIGDSTITVSSIASTVTNVESALTAALTAGTHVTVTGTDLKLTAGKNKFEFKDADGKYQEFTVTGAGGKLTFEQTKAPTKAGEVVSFNSKNVTVTAGTDTTATGTGNISTTVNTQGTEEKKAQLASTSFQLTADMVKAGNSVTIGGTTYTFVEKKENDATLGANEIAMFGKDGKVNLDVAGHSLSQKANTKFSIGYDAAAGKITITEIAGQFAGDAKLDTLDKISEQLSWNKASAGTTGLNLQIGDSSEDFNQLKVTVNDMHASALGIGAIDISTQAGAKSAIEDIMKAINSVSSTRGDLGAIQNRLEHTSNNLGIMKENIQDAESTIRDTDVADEMMAYTKNNILIQSAQAMLAQANQVPQGVLQLLQ